MFSKIIKPVLLILVILVAALFPVLPSLGVFNAELWRQLILIGVAGLLLAAVLFSVAVGQAVTLKSNLITVGLAAWALATVAAAISSPSSLKSLATPGTWLPLAILIWYTLLISLAAGKVAIAKIVVMVSAVVLSVVTLVVALVAPWGLTVSVNSAVIVFLLIGVAVAVSELIATKNLIGRVLTSASLVVIGLSLILIMASVVSLPVVGGKVRVASDLSPQASWMVAAESIKFRPLFGTGPGNFVNSYTSVRSDPARTYFSAGSQVFDSLATTGLVGLSGLIILLIALIVETWRRPVIAAKLLSLGLVVAALLTVFNPMLLAVVLILGLMASPEDGFAHTLKVESPVAKLVMAVIGLLLLGTVYLTGRVGAADVYYYRSQTTNSLQEVYDNARTAVSLNPYNDGYRRSYASSSLAIAKFLAENTKQLSAQDKANITTLLQTALGQSQVAANQIDAANYLNWQTQGNVFEAVQGLLDQATASAVSSYNQAITLDPLNPALRVQLGNLFMSAKSYNQAAQFFASAVNLKPDYIEARIGLANSLELLGGYQEAATELKAVQSLVKADSEDFKTLQTKIEALEKAATAPTTK